ncbi:hypothetical protein D3C74_150610 [compost metagenome]
MNLNDSYRKISVFLMCLQTEVLLLKSSNPDYRFDLYSIDWSTDLASLTRFGGRVSELKFAKDLKAGDWGLRISSAGRCRRGICYSYECDLASRFISPDNSLSENLSHTVVEYPNGDIKVNGVQVANTKIANPDLSWKREFDFSSHGSYSTVIMKYQMFGYEQFQYQ